MLSYKVYGTTGPALVLLHGFPLDHHMWIPAAQHLAAWCRVILPDLGGFGMSPLSFSLSLNQVEHNSAVEWTLADYAAEVEEILEHLHWPRPCLLGGLSMGGYVAFQCWQKFGARLAGMILCDTRVQADTPAAAVGRREMAARVLQEGSGFLPGAMLPKLLWPETWQQSPTVPTDLTAVMENAPASGVAAACLAMSVRPDVTELLPAINVPALVVCGQHDVISPPEEMAAWASKLPRGEFAMIPAAGHMAPLEQPLLFANVVRSWAGRYWPENPAEN
ncbi:MAG: alpha/beta fold hydrolase [Pirellulales bacterium]|nr:alpha/beta fold hydrolase [Pirellulales bacterium]